MKIRNKQISTTTVALLGVIALLSSALATVWLTKQFEGSMYLQTEYDLGMYETGTTTPISSFDFGGFVVGESKTFIYDLVNEGNVQENYWYGLSTPSGWTIEIWEKNFDATEWNPWYATVTGALTGIDPQHRKNIKVVVTEAGTVVEQGYGFTMTISVEEYVA
jgi:hypothetical protein